MADTDAIQGSDSESEQEESYSVIAECEVKTFEKLAKEYGVRWCERCCMKICDVVEGWIELVPPYLNFKKFCARHEFRKYDDKVVLECKHSWPDWAR